jgi:putative transposase
MPKSLLTEHGEVRIETPRDRQGTFEPQIVRKRQRRFEGFDDKILALYSRGVSTRDIEAHLEEIYGVKVGRDLISRVTDAVMDDARAWQTRPLDDVYPVVFLDALVLKIRDGARCSARPATWRSRSRWTATARCSACGSKTTKAPSSGCRCSPI